ncbi:hypothetical protein IWQ57_000772 [Coemansia nantahalensis]|uniref:Uncharacterized protein n=1 Tax=Coemansia nantahalensis TaxID=2789366 RepID=A0ACC1K6T4_9FUNG|nr:hypothetical protein IWQ57_000772 [Coemansia nantahalensis]
MHREEDKWDKDSRESLATMLARMPRLGKVRLFESAKWFIDDATKSNREDLKHLACNVRIEYYEVDHNDYDYDDYDDYDDESRDDSGDEDSSEDDNDDGDDVGSDDESSDDSDDDSSAY